MKPLVLLIIILVVLALLFFTGVSVGVFGGKDQGGKPPDWLKGLGSVLPGREPLDPKDIKPSRDGVFNPSTGVLTLGMGSITLGIEQSKSKVRTATITVASGAVSVSFTPKEEKDGFAKFSN